MSMRVNQLAKHLDVSSQVLISLLEDIGVTEKTHSSSVQYDWAVKVCQRLSRKPPPPWEDKAPKKEKAKTAVAGEGTPEEGKEKKPAEVFVHHPREIEEKPQGEAPVPTEQPAPAIAAEKAAPAKAVAVSGKEEAPPVPAIAETPRIAAREKAPKAKDAAAPAPAAETAPAPAKPDLDAEEAEKRRQQRALLARRFQAVRQAPTAKKKDVKPIAGPAAPPARVGGSKGRPKGRGAATWKREKRERYEAAIEAEQTIAEKQKRTLRVNETTTVADIADGLGMPVSKVISTLFAMGVKATINQRLDLDTIHILADEFGFEVEEHTVQEDILLDVVAEEIDESKMVHRPPVVTIMGHVDHGKTKLLDAIRKTNVVAQEAGGITQHTSAFMVSVPGGQICFLDTPGHEAFTAMRYRGAQVTDIVILVVAADDGVMPQTIEAINHARAANVPIIVAINKVDLPSANVDRVKSQLSDHNLAPVEWGGKTETVAISALKKQGISDLLDTILLQAELLELKANPDRPAQGTIVEARQDRGRGPVASVIVQQGTLREGDPLVSGAVSGKVRGMFNERGEPVKAAGPSTPVEVLGLAGVPQAGDPFHVAPDERSAKQYAIRLQQAQREREMMRRHHVSLSGLFTAIEGGQLKDLHLVVKADVQGTAEALVESLEGIESDKVRVRVIHSGVGAISESDVQLAAASDAIVIGFHVRVAPAARELAARENVEINTYDIIYEAIEAIRAAMQGLLEKKIEERVEGHAQVREVFRASRVGTIIGTRVTDGVIRRSSRVRLIRNDQIVYQGRISSLRRFKDDVAEVTQGLECGIGLENYQDVKPGDILETYELVEVAQVL